MSATKLSIPGRDEVQADVGLCGLDVAEEDTDRLQRRQYYWTTILQMIVTPAILEERPAAARCTVNTAGLVRSVRGTRAENQVERRVRGALRSLLAQTLGKAIRIFFR